MCTLVMAGCGASHPIRFMVTPDVTQTLAAWRDAGIACGEAEVGWPGPAADWQCRTTAAGLDVRVRLIADAIGVQTIFLGVDLDSDRSSAAQAFADVVEVTPALGDGRPAIETWLVDNDAADGLMPRPLPPSMGRVSIDSGDARSVILYLTPAGSSICLATAGAPSQPSAC